MERCSYIVAEDLNTSDKQFLYIDQEHDDRIETLEGFVPTVRRQQSLRARQRKIQMIQRGVVTSE